MKFDKENYITNKKSLRDLLSLKDLSQYFYQKSNGLVACFLTTVFVSYLILVMMGQAAEFEVIDSNIKSLGTSFGFEESDIYLGENVGMSMLQIILLRISEKSVLFSDESSTASCSITTNVLSQARKLFISPR
jgi:hypothetical protein